MENIKDDVGKYRISLSSEIGVINRASLNRANLNRIVLDSHQDLIFVLKYKLPVWKN